MILHSAGLSVEGGRFVAAWQPDKGMIFLSVLSEARVGDEAAVRVAIMGCAIRATLFGKISFVRRAGRPSIPPGIGLTLDRMSLPAAHFLAAAARGEPVRYQDRAPRYLVERKLRIERAAVRFDARLLNVSEGGCALSWAGQLPKVGEVIALRIGQGLFSRVVRAVVCWNSVGGTRDRSIGVRVLIEGRGGRAWSRLAAEIAQGALRSM